MTLSHDMDKSFYKKLVFFAVPLAFQNLIASSLNMVDTVMVGQLGEVALTAVGIVNQIYFMMLVFIFGIIGGEIIFVAQFWGNKDIPNIKKTQGISVLAGVAISGLIALLCGIFPYKIMGLFSSDPNVIKAGVDYLLIVVFCFPFVSLSFTYLTTLKGTGIVRLPVIINVIAILINTGLNYVLIFGKAGFPEMGVRGAAIATLISRVLECVLIIGITYIKKYAAAAASFSEMFGFNKIFLRRFIKTGSPILFTEIFWALAMTVYMGIYTNMGTGAGAAANIARTVESLMFVFILGVNCAAEIIQGNELGAGHLDQAWQNSKKIIGITLIVSIIIGGITAVLAVPISTLFAISQEVRLVTVRLIIICSIMLIFRSLNCVIVEGMLRPGGDSKPGLYANIGAMWIIGIPLSIIGSVVLGWSIVWVFSIRILEEFLKTGYLIKRYRSKIWVKNIVHDIKNI